MSKIYSHFMRSYTAVVTYLTFPLEKFHFARPRTIASPGLPESVSAETLNPTATQHLGAGAGRRQPPPPPRAMQVKPGICVGFVRVWDSGATDSVGFTDLGSQVFGWGV